MDFAFEKSGEMRGFTAMEVGQLYRDVFSIWECICKVPGYCFSFCAIVLGSFVSIYSFVVYIGYIVKNSVLSMVFQ